MKSALRASSDRVAFLLLDGVELDTIRFFGEQGLLPNLTRLLAEGHFTPIASRDNYSAEVTPTEMLTGRTAEDLRYWSITNFDPSTYKTTNVGAYRGPAFYDRDDIRSIVFDVPHMRIDETTPGIQVAGWGAHSPQFPLSSNPPQVIVDLEAEFGPMHTPEFEDIHSSHNTTWGRGVTDHMLDSLDKRPRVVSWLMEREPDWNLLIIGATECHSHEHAFHHVVDPAHELYNHPTTPAALTFMEDLFVALDHMVGRVEALLPEGTIFTIGAMHGAKPSAIDTTTVLAGELIYRLETGRRLLDLPLSVDQPIELEPWLRARGYMHRYRVRPGKPVKAGAKAAVIHYLQWACHRFAQGRPELELERVARRAQGLSPNWWELKKGSAITTPPDLSGPLDVEEIATEPSNWYAEHWPKMRYFVLPSFSGLQIRINLAGREKHGIVAADAYELICDEVEEILSTMTNARTGEKLVERFIRLRSDDPFRNDGPGADIAVVVDAATTIAHPRVGVLGTVPFGRVAEHSERGWIVVDDERAFSAVAGDAKTIDVGPTLIELLGLAPLDRYTGSPAVKLATPALGDRG